MFLIAFDNKRNNNSNSNSEIKSYIEESTLENIYNPQGRFPSLEDRVAATGVPYDRKDIEFESRVASCVSAVAMARYNQGKSNLAVSVIQEKLLLLSKKPLMSIRIISSLIRVL